MHEPCFPYGYTPSVRKTRFRLKAEKQSCLGRPGLSAPVGIVGGPVATIGNAVAVAVAPIPASALEAPPPVTLHPLMRAVCIALALAHPISLHPHMPIASPVPISRGPGVAPARRRNAFLARWRRSAVHGDLAIGGGSTRNRCCNDADGSGGNHYGNQNFIDE